MPKNDTSTKKKFSKIDIPVALSHDEKLKYLSLHYWDSFDFDDTTFISLPEITEQAFVDYSSLLSILPLDASSRAIKQTINKARVNNKVLKHFISLSEKYYYNPNSFLKNEELYIPVLEEIIYSELDDTEKIRYRYQLEQAYKNRLGTKASNFLMTLANGNTISLYDIKSPQILILFSDPVCNICETVKNDLLKSDRLNNLLNNKQISVINFYPDEDIQSWINNLHTFPKNWINAYDKKMTVKKEQIYDLKALPSMYLLDSNKIVVGKDIATVNQLESFFIK